MAFCKVGLLLCKSDSREQIRFNYVQTRNSENPAKLKPHMLKKSIQIIFLVIGFDIKEKHIEIFDNRVLQSAIDAGK